MKISNKLIVLREKKGVILCQKSKIIPIHLQRKQVL